MNFWSYVKEEKHYLYMIIIVLFIFNVNILLDVSLETIINSLLYINVFSIIIIILFLYFIGFKSYKNKRNQIINHIEKNNDMDDFYPNDSIYELIDSKHDEYRKEIENLKNELNEINDYMTNWIHQVKIPISVLEIISQRVEDLEKDDRLSKDMNLELDRITALVEQALYISRAGNYSSDFHIGEMNVGKIVKEVIRKNKYLFIYNKIDLKMSNLDYDIVSDKKWIKHILEQIIHNACKYMDDYKKLHVFIEEDEKSIQLHIKDSGIGIAKSDIERVFDKGFTGENGRNRTKSTGMGLYVSKKIANKLSHDISIESEKGKGTDVILTFYKLSDYFNVT